MKKYTTIFCLLICGCLATITIFVLNSKETPKNQVDESENLLIEKKEKLGQERNYEKQIPMFVQDCSDNNKSLVLNKLNFFASHNPFFLRGDFDGDGNIDYAITVENVENKKEGLLVCFASKKKKAVLIGPALKTPPFWSLRTWDIQTADEIKDLVDHKNNPINISPKGESIVMTWEDSVGVIYWNGKEFLWKLVILNEGI